MLRHYLKTAWKVLLRRKFFTAISLFGISFTLVVLMVATAIIDNSFGPNPPEVRQDRTVTVFRATMYGEHATWNGGAGYKLLDRYARNLPGAERLSISSAPRASLAFVGGQKITLQLRRADAEYWKILEFDFLEGGPFNTQDVAEARLVAVINAATRDRIFGGRDARGKTLEADGQRFQVVGVVRDVPAMRMIPYADVWVPLTTAKSDAFKNEIMGGHMGIVLATSADAIPAMREEFKSRMRRVEVPDPKTFQHLVALLETPFERLGGEMFGQKDDEDIHVERLWIAIGLVGFLFMLLPTVNLINLNVSRIMERASEIGVRKAFGASSRTLVGQFIVENVVLTLIGAVFGFVLSFFVLKALTASGVVRYAVFHLNHRVFLYGVAIALFFGVVSGVYPAWRMSRLNPVQALKGASR
jgi:putative ABC transport system permease protein